MFHISSIIWEYYNWEGLIVEENLINLVIVG